MNDTQTQTQKTKIEKVTSTNSEFRKKAKSVNKKHLRIA